MYEEFRPSTVARMIESGKVDDLLMHIYIRDIRPVVQAAVESRWADLR